MVNLKQYIFEDFLVYFSGAELQSLFSDTYL